MSDDQVSRDDLVVVARIGRPHGVRGEIKAWPFDEDSGCLFEVETIFLAKEERGPFEAHRLRSARGANRSILLTLEGVSGREQAEALKSRLVLVHRSELPALDDPNEFYHFELIGMPVSTSAGEKLGRIAEIWDTGAGDVLLIRDEENQTEVMIPFVQSFVEVDEEQDVLIVEPPEGLIEATRVAIGASSGEKKPKKKRSIRNRNKGKASGAPKTSKGVEGP